MNKQYFAKIENGIVVNIAVVTAEFLTANPARYSGTWVETFIGIEGKTYAGVGYIWNGTDFVAPVAPELPVEE